MAAEDVRTDPISDGIVHLGQLEPLARQRLSGPVWDYVAGGAGDETTLTRNRTAWNDISLAPHVLVDASATDTRIELLGNRLSNPILLAPTARHAAYHPQAEAATLQGAAASGALPVISSLASCTLDQVATAADNAGTPWWFQLYVQEDRDWTEGLVQRAVAAGASSLIVTVDTPTLGARDLDKRDNLGAGVGATYPILDGSPVQVDPTPAHRRVYNPHLSPSITWDDLAWLVQVCPVPVVPKGIVRADDARRALDCGVAAVFVSNHGARNLDTVVPTAVALPAVAAAVNSAVPVIVDGGIRRGTDVAKALAMGASAVMIGRPAIWGLTTYGAEGVAHVVEILETELRMAMALLGTPTIADLTVDALW